MQQVAEWLEKLGLGNTRSALPPSAFPSCLISPTTSKKLRSSTPVAARDQDGSRDALTAVEQQTKGGAKPK